MAYWDHEETFSGIGNGTVLDMSLQPAKYFSLQVRQESGLALLWSVLLEVSLNGSEWSTIASHTNVAQSLGDIVLPQIVPYPARYLRFRVTGVTVGASIKASALAMD